MLDVRDFSRRVWLSGGRDQVPAGFLRRAKGIAPEFTGSVKSMWPPQLQYPGITALNLEYFQGRYYQFDGTQLYSGGASIYSGGSGARATFETAPPQSGDQDYLFMAGSGNLIKVSPTNIVQNWGIQPPNNQMVATKVAQESIVIDTFVGSHTNWTPVGCAVSDVSTPAAIGAGSLDVDPSTNWNIINNSTFTAGAAPLDLGNYADGTISLPTDLVSFWFYFNNSSPTNPNWIQLDFDVNDGSFKLDYYSIVLGMIPAGSTKPVTKIDVTVSVTFQNGTWQQLFLPKDTFTRIGTTLAKDWTNVQAVRFSGNNFTGNLYLDNLAIFGGAPLGIGPAAATGGSQYAYVTVFRNLGTSNQSNPQDEPTLVSGVACQSVKLTQIPVSSDTQVGARDLYRSVAGVAGATGFLSYLDTIYNNFATTYTDITADAIVVETLTPWEPSTAVPPNSGCIAYYVDGGNGFYFKLTTPGTTGTTPPAWVFPNATWAAQAAFFVGDTVSPPQANGALWTCSNAGVSGLFRPNFGASASPLTDGTVMWTRTGTVTTTDGTAVWTFQGVNSTPTLTTNLPLLYDNVAPFETIQDCVYWKAQNVMVFARDTANPGRVYFSPPGRLESIQTFTDIGSTNDMVQKVVDYQNTLWAITQKQVGYFNVVTDTQGNVSYQWVKQYTEGVGTDWPFTVIETQEGIFYRGTEGIHRANWAVDQLYGFDPISPVLRGYTAEDVGPFFPTIAGLGRNEVYFSNTANLMMAVDVVRPFWRTFDQPVTAINYIKQTREVVASYGGNVYLFEHQTLLGTPLPFDWEIEVPSVEIQNSAQNQSQRTYLDINTSGQQVTPTLLADNGNFVLPVVITTARTTIELPYQACGHVFGVLLQATPSTGIIEVFRVAVDIAT